MARHLILFFPCVLAALLAGCNPPAESTETPPAPQPPVADSQPTPPSSGDDAGEPSAPSGAPSAEEKKLAELEEKFKAASTDKKLKAEVVEAAYQAGHSMMLNPDLPPRTKYRGALKHLRRALALDPDHKGANADKKQIEDVYAIMGRPIPE
jgi:hypothetical protein